MVGTSSSGNHFSKEHGLLLFLPSELQLALARLQTNRSLGRSYAGLLAVTEGFHELGCLDKEEYEALKERYSQKLPCSIVVERRKPRILEDAQEQTKLRKLEVDFSNTIKQWNTMKPKAREYWVKKAEEYRDKVPNAKIVLALASEVGDPIKQETLAGGP